MKRFTKHDSLWVSSYGFKMLIRRETSQPILVTMILHCSSDVTAHGDIANRPTLVAIAQLQSLVQY